MKSLSRTAVVAVAAAMFLIGAAQSLALPNEFNRYSLESVEAQLSTVQAGAHADLTVSFRLTETESEPFGLTRDLIVQLPPGMIGNPQGIPRCTSLQLGNLPKESECPISSQVGVSSVTLGGKNAGTFTEPIYNMQPAGPDTVARLGLFAGPFPVTLDVTIDPTDYSLVARIEGAPAAAELLGAATTLWGVPASPTHDTLRLTPAEALAHNSGPPGGRPAGLPESPFLTNPTSCGLSGEVTVTATSYQLPGTPSVMSAPFPSIGGCGSLSFSPKFTLAVTNPEVSAPTGIDADLEVPQDETPMGRGTSALKSAVVTLPPGLTINPSAGDGLAACSVEQVGFERNEPAHCPDASKIGSAEIDVPALEHVLKGSVYQRSPEPGHLFRFWLVADELGVHLKLPAEIEANHSTGQLTTRFAGIPSLGGNPEVPVADLQLHIFGGPRAPVSTPATCGTYSAHYEFAPWSGNAPAGGDSSFSITSGCGKGGFSPKIVAGTANPFAGQYSPLVFQLMRADGEANPERLEVALPEGLLARLGGVPLCPDSSTGSGACPAASQVGTVGVAAGVGGAPLWIPLPGKEPTAVFLAGPYKDAPYSLVVKVPAQAGPFDLGTVVTRAAIYVDQETARATIVSDPLPQILEGVPVSYRTVRVETNQPEFTLNPTNCAPQSIEARVTASNGQKASPSVGFQASNCAKLGFAPKLSLSLKGNTKRSGNPALSATLMPKAGNANIARATVTLPPSEFIAPSHINNPCTRMQFNAGQCPRTSVLGSARAFTPLLDLPLEGPVYFRSNGGERKLPDIVADLRGPIRIVLVGFINSKKKKGSDVSQVRTTFANVPDAPVSKFTMNLFGGKRGLLENSVNLCVEPRHVEIQLSGQNGRLEESNPALPIKSCGKGKHRKIGGGPR